MKTTFKFKKTPFEELAMNITQIAISDVAKQFNDNDCLTNPDTGEIVEVCELKRVLGILDFLLNCDEVEKI